MRGMVYAKQLFLLSESCLLWLFKGGPSKVSHLQIAAHLSIILLLAYCIYTHIHTLFFKLFLLSLTIKHQDICDKIANNAFSNLKKISSSKI